MADIRQSGIGGLHGVNTQSGVTNTMTPEQQAFHEQVQRESKLVKHGRSLSYQAPYETMLRPKTYEVGSAEREYGKSRYDKGHDILPVSGFDELQQNRYDNQPWYDVAANGIAKAAGRAATSFITGVAGGLWGIGEFVTEGVRNGDWNATRLIDNSLSNALADLDEWADKNFVNYKSIIQRQNEENGEWYKNLGSLNMIMDDIVTNFGFIVGMGASAAVTGGALGAGANLLRKGAAGAMRAARRSGNMAKIAAATKAAGIVDKYGRQTAKALTMINSSAGEAALEGLTVRREMMDEETARINDSISEGMRNDPELQALDAQYQQQIDQLEEQYAMRPKDANYQALKNAISQDYHNRRSAVTQQWEQRRAAAMEELNQSSEEAGMATALLNMAILIPSNFNLYGRLVDKSFRNAEKSAGKAWASNNSAIHARNGIGQRNVTGGIQGKSMAAIRNGKNYGSRTFLGNEAKRIGSTVFSEGIYEEMGQSAVSTGAKAYHEWADADNYWRARLDPDSINDVTDGSHDFLQALGQGLSETYGSIDGWREGFIGGITGGLFGGASVGTEWRDTRFARRAAKDLNKQLQSDRLPNLLQHIVAQGFHEKNKEGYAAEGNQRDWKTEDDKAAFSLISSFDRAGRMDDLYYLINSYTEGMSDEDIEDLVNSSTRRVTSQEQIAQMKKTIQQETAQKVESFLRDGASIDDYNAATTAVRDADERVAQAEQAVEAARQRAADESGDTRWLQKSAQSIRNQARTARRSKNKAMAKDIRDALDALDSARAAQANANRSLNSMMASQDSKAGIDAALAEHEDRMRRADNSAPEEFLEGPFSNANGTNTLTNDEVREQIKHNTDRIHEVVERYKDAVEKVNRDTRGILSKDQEDYLAYTQFMAESSGQRAQEIVQKWRGVLPEVLSVRHKSAKAAAKMLQVSENEVVEDPDNPGFFRVSTKNMTDEQFSNFILHGLLKQSHVKHKNDDGSGADSEALRGSLADEALNLIDKEMRRANKQQRFDRDELRRDFDDVEDHFKKNKAFAEAYMDALSNPEGVMSAKDRWMRKLKKKYDQTKAKLRQKRMSVQQLGDLSDDELSGLDDYHYALAKAEKIRRKVADFFNRKAPDIYSKIEDVFKDIQDPDVRAEIIERVKDRIDTIISRMSRYEEEDGPIDVDSEEIAAMIRLDDLFEDDDFWDSLDKKTKDAIRSGLNTISDMLKDVLKTANSTIRRLRRFFDNLRSKADAVNGSDDPKSLFDRVTSILSKAVTHATDIDELRELKKKIQDKLTELSSGSGIGNSAAAKMLKGLLKKINDYISSAHSQNSPDSEPENTGTPAYGQPAAKSGGTRAQSSPKGSTPTNDEELNQNPDQSEEEKAVDDAAETSLHIRFTEGSCIPAHPWQTVTGEYARRSDFTYQTYHDLVQSKLDAWDEKHPSPTEDELNEELPIDELRPYGYKHKVKDWKRLALRSRIVRARIASDGHVGFMDEGNVKAGDLIRFMIEDSEVGPIVYLVHEDKDGVQTIIGDLTEPDRELGADEDPDLLRLWSLLEQEFNASGQATLISKKYSTHVGNVYSGFVKYRGKDAAGVRQYSTVSSLKGSENVEFHIIGTNPVYEDVFGSGKRGQPVAVIPRPGNDGMTRRVAVPVITTPFTEDSVEAKVIAQAAKNLNESELQTFLKNFLHCSQVFISSREVTDADTGKTVTMYTVDVKTRNTAAKSSGKVEAGSRISQRFTVSNDGEISLDKGSILRANVSNKLMNNDLYKKATSGGDGIPTNYTNFLKDVCQTSVEDFNIHNSWVTVNPITVGEDDSITEHNTTKFTDKKTINVKGNVDVTISDPINNLVYIVEFDKKSSVPTVVSIRGGSAQSKLPVITVKGANKAEMLEKIAIAASRMLNSPDYDATNSFVFNGIKYEYYLENSGAVSDVAIAEDQRAPSKAALDAATFNELSYIAHHFNGKNLPAVINAFFYPDRFKNNKSLQRDLETLLKEMRDGKTKYSLGFSAQAALLNTHKPVTTRARNVANALMKHLKSKGINVITDSAQGRARLDAAQEVVKNDGRDAIDNNDGISYFLDRSGTVVYGFVDKTADTPTIYLDSELLNPETVIHEYTHLWAQCLKQGAPEVWNALVDDLGKRYPTVWQDVVRTYGTRVKNKDNSINRDKVADEVFASITGDKYAKEFVQRIGAGGTSSNSIISGLRKMYNNFINAVRAFFNKPLAETLQELVVQDLVSDNPLHNFGIIDQVAEHYGISEQMPSPEQEGSPAEEAKPSEEKLTLSPEDGYTAPQLIKANSQFKKKGIKFKLDPRTATYTFASSKDRQRALDILSSGISAHININDVDVSISPQASEAFDKLGELFLRNLKRVSSRGYAFDGVSNHIESMNFGINRGHLSSVDFLLAVDLLLDEDDRSKMWKAAITAIDRDIPNNAAMVAEINNLFNARLQGDYSGNKELDAMFDALVLKIQNLYKNSDTVSRTEEALNDVTSGIVATSPKDRIGSMTAEEHEQAYRESLNRLTDKDLEVLDYAGYSETMYMNSPNLIKEWFRRCVL